MHMENLFMLFMPMENSQTSNVQPASIDGQCVAALGQE